MFGLKVRPQPPIDVFYDGSALGFGDYEVRVHHTPGHCPGGVCLQIGATGQADPPHLFVGDTLFAGSIGRTDLPGGDYDVLMRSITGVLFPLGDDAIVHPGHGPDTTIGRERRTNPFVLEYVAGKNAVSRPLASGPPEGGPPRWLQSTLAQRHQLDPADLEAVAGGEPRPFDPFAVHERPVGALEVPHLELAVAAGRGAGSAPGTPARRRR